MKKVKKLVATTGEYVDGNGQTKKRYQTVGNVFADGDRRAIKIDALPIGGEWNGWLSVYDLDDPQQNSGYGKNTAPAAAPADDYENDVPF